MQTVMIKSWSKSSETALLETIVSSHFKSPPSKFASRQSNLQICSVPLETLPAALIYVFSSIPNCS